MTVPNLARNWGPVPSCNNFKQIKTSAVTTAPLVRAAEILSLYEDVVYFWNFDVPADSGR